MNTLKFINANNSCYDNKLYNLNIQYLTKLNDLIISFITKLQNIKIKDKILYEIINHLNLSNNIDFNFNDINITEHNNLLYFICEIMKNIPKLKNDIPNYNNIINTELRAICDEYFIFHNNIIKKIKIFLKYYTHYINKLIKLHNLLCEINKPIYENYNLLVTYNGANGVDDPNFPSRKLEFQKKILLGVEYLNYIKNEIDSYNYIKTETKNINIDFLNEIKKLSYN
jgi:hypothetical protein